MLLAIKHIKEVIKKNVAFEKIEQFTKRNKMQAENQNATYNLSEQPESDDVVLMSHIQEPSSSSSQNEWVNFTQNREEVVVHGTAVSESNNKIEQDPMDAVRKDITSLKSFQETVAKKRYELEKVLIISQQTNPNSRYRQCWDW